MKGLHPSAFPSTRWCRFEPDLISPVSVGGWRLAGDRPVWL